MIELRDGECYNDSVALAEGEFGSLGCPALTYRCNVRRKGEEYRLEIDFNVAMNLPCSRCLREAKYSYEAQIDAICSQQIAEEDVEEYVLRINRGKVDILEPIVQEIELNMPISHVCDDDCQGICPVCGTYRPCECKSDTGNP
ncbi:MAG: YceD family protein, partial [Bacillota bacterium]|nr:YceD family protein [Bacillota bacterium]